jgi:isoamyl acetate esterase
VITTHNYIPVQVTYDALMRTIAERYPEVHPDSLPFVFPGWLQHVEGQQKALV